MAKNLGLLLHTTRGGISLSINRDYFYLIRVYWYTLCEKLSLRQRAFSRTRERSWQTFLSYLSIFPSSLPNGKFRRLSLPLFLIPTSYTEISLVRTVLSTSMVFIHRMKRNRNTCVCEVVHRNLLPRWFAHGNICLYIE